MEPTEEDIYSPEFDAIWQAIKGWDIQREENALSAGATGTDVMAILNALRETKKIVPLDINQRIVICVNVECKWYQIERVINYPHIGRGLFMPATVLCECSYMPRLLGN